MSATLDIPSPSVSAQKRATPCRTIWIDLDNSPHVPFFRPIIDELKRRNYEILITARDAYQVRELLDFYGVSGKVIGKHYGKHKLLKGLGTVWRAIALTAVVSRQKTKPILSLCHGSRGCLLTSTLLGIPNLTLTDYEFTTGVPTIRPRWLMVPSVVPADRLHMAESRILKYPGIKEDVYLSCFRPDTTLRKRLGIGADELLVTVRPPATEAHYHNPESELLLEEALKRFMADPGTRVILLPRNSRQEAELRSTWKAELATGRITIPVHVEDGLNLIWNSDFVVSGGGTMNREAAAMGVPVYSIFRGKIGAVDTYLAEAGRLTLLESVEDVHKKIRMERRPKGRNAKASSPPALQAVVEGIETLVEQRLSENPAL